LATGLSIEFIRHHISAFVAHNNIEPTAQWQDVIEYALRTCHATVALLTSDFPASKWTDQEIGATHIRNVLIIPIKIDIDPYGFIGKYQALPGKDRTLDYLTSRIFMLLIKHDKTKMYMAQSIVAMLEESDTYQSAKDAMTFLEQIDYLDKQLIKRLQTAAKTNSQIYDAFGVPERLKSYIKKAKEVG